MGYDFYGSIFFIVFIMYIPWWVGLKGYAFRISAGGLPWYAILSSIGIDKLPILCI